MKIQLAWLDQNLDEFEAQVRLQAYLEAGFDPDVAAAVASATIHLEELKELRSRVEHLEWVVEAVVEKLEQIESKE
jgi:flagellar basal body P-ring protein FlgI